MNDTWSSFLLWTQLLCPTFFSVEGCSFCWESPSSLPTPPPASVASVAGPEAVWRKLVMGHTTVRHLPTQVSLVVQGSLRGPLPPLPEAREPHFVCLTAAHIQSCPENDPFKHRKFSGPQNDLPFVLTLVGRPFLQASHVSRAGAPGTSL